MGRKPTKRRDDKAATPRAIKVTIRLDRALADRLAVAATLRRVPMGVVVAESLAPALRSIRMPTVPGVTTDASDPGEDAA